MSGKLFVRLRAGGQQITGDVSVNAVGDTDVSSEHIEAHGFYHELTSAVDSGVRTRSSATYGPITFIKTMDRATPMLMAAWGQGRPIEGAFKFFGQTREGLEQVQQVYEIEQARIVAVRVEMVNNRTSEGATMPVLERVTLAYGQLKVINVTNSVEWQANVRDGLR